MCLSKRRFLDRCLLFALFFTGGVLLLASCQQGTKQQEQASGAYQAVDARGKQISLAKPVERLVVLFEPMVDEIYMLQAQDCLVGIPEQVYQNASGFSFLSALDSRMANKEIATPTFGGRANNMESIIGLRPDLVIAYEPDQETIAQLEGLNIPVFAVSSLDKEHIYNELRGVATLLGKQDRAEELISYVDGELDKMQQPASGERKKAYYAWSKGRVLSTSGKGSLIDLAMEMAGAENACPLELEAPNVGAESLYKWNPDLIILWNSQLDDVYSLKELAALPAVKNKQVYVLDPTFNFDPHTIKFMLFAKQLHQWCYPDDKQGDVKDDVQEALKVFYPLYKS